MPVESVGTAFPASGGSGPSGGGKAATGEPQGRDCDSRLCEGCGEPIVGGRAHKRHHGPACRKRSHVSRQQAALIADRDQLRAQLTCGARVVDAARACLAAGGSRERKAALRAALAAYDQAVTEG